MLPESIQAAAQAGKWLRRSTGLLLVALAVAWCSGASKDGPLAAGTTPGTLCMVSPEGQSVTWGWEVITNGGDGPVTLVDVGLVDDSSLEVVEAWVVPTAMTLVGNQATFPPDPGISPQWAQRREAAGAVLEPGEAANLVLGVQPRGGADGRAAGTRTRYTDDSGRELTVTAATALEVLQSRSRC